MQLYVQFLNAISRGCRLLTELSSLTHVGISFVCDVFLGFQYSMGSILKDVLVGNDGVSKIHRIVNILKQRMGIFEKMLHTWY